jgi:transcriptional regulator with XRE-family HTH domain
MPHNRIYQRRQALGLSQTELATLLGWSTSHQSRIERNRTTHPTADEAAALELVLSAIGAARRIVGAYTEEEPT